MQLEQTVLSLTFSLSHYSFLTWHSVQVLLRVAHQQKQAQTFLLEPKPLVALRQYCWHWSKWVLKRSSVTGGQGWRRNLFLLLQASFLCNAGRASWRAPGMLRGVKWRYLGPGLPASWVLARWAVGIKLDQDAERRNRIIVVKLENGWNVADNEKD